MPVWGTVLGDKRWRRLVVNGPLCALSLCCIKRALLNLINKKLPVNRTKLLHELLRGTCSILSRELPLPLCAGTMDAGCIQHDQLVLLQVYQQRHPVLCWKTRRITKMLGWFWSWSGVLPTRLLSALEEQVEQLQLLGDGFPPQPFKLRAGERAEAEVTSEGNI